MKNLLALFFALFMLNSINGQEVKNQTEQIKLLKIGNYVSYKVNKKDNGKYYFTPWGLKCELNSVEQEKNFVEHKYINFQIFGSGHSTPESYLPDNMGFPVTLAKVAYEGNAKLQKKVGYVPREIIQGKTKRFVVFKGMIFRLSTSFDPEKPSTFEPISIYVHDSYGKTSKTEENSKKKKKKKSFFKNLKSKALSKLASHPSEIKLNDESPVEELLNYLKKAIAKQKSIYPTWKTKTANKLRLANLEKRRKLMDKAMYDYNEAYKKSDEWKRIQENERRANSAAAANNTTIANNTGRDIYVYEEGSYNGTRINNGSSQSFGCNSTYYYSFSGNSKWSAGTKISGTSCGGTATVR